LPKHLDTAHKLINGVMARRRYGKRARFSQRDDRPMPNSFEEGCPFLQYSGLSHGCDSEIDD
ncbi:hypothetical protein ACNRC9_10670, partial [Ralstonia pseudosolanacearum]|uniref:hypothetical protein n=1 Tax=Ralstonia pseudosolanacearum TaxID=1310165 RepID=UPI003AAC5A56